MDVEVSCMQMILHSGNARANAYEVIDCVKEKSFERANELLKNAKDELFISQKHMQNYCDKWQMLKMRK